MMYLRKKNTIKQTKGEVISMAKNRKQQAQGEDQFWDKQVVVGEMPKSNSVKQVVSCVYRAADPEKEDSKPVVGIDIREFYKKKDATEWRPSSKGIVIKLENIETFDQLFTEAMETMTAMLSDLTGGKSDKKSAKKTGGKKTKES